MSSDRCRHSDPHPTACRRQQFPLAEGDDPLLFVALFHHLVDLCRADVEGSYQDTDQRRQRTCRLYWAKQALFSIAETARDVHKCSGVPTHVRPHLIYLPSNTVTSVFYFASVTVTGKYPSVAT